MITLTFPTNVQLDLLTQEYQINRANFIGIGRVAPLAERQAHIVEWDQMDFDTGMTPPHVLGTDPKIETRPGSVRRRYEPGAFKASEMVDEGEILRGRQLGSFGNMLNLDGLVARRLAARQDKTFIRMEWCVWKALGGALAINENDVVINETFPVQTFATVVPWSTHATATPYSDLMDVGQKFPGTGASGDGAVVYVNQKTMNDVLRNKNDDDIWGMRGPGFAKQTYSIKQVNQILSDNSLPTLQVYDEGYPDVNKVYQRFISDGKPIVIGKRPPGQVVANFLSTISLHRTVNGISAPGPFSIIEVNGGPNNGALTVSMESLGQSSNPNLKLTGGIYGGPVIWYPRSVIAMDVTHTGA